MTILEGNLLHPKFNKFYFIFAILLIAALLQYKNILEYFYPLEYKALIDKSSTEYGLDPYLVYALINVESHYNPDARSPKDAKGLMQITASTGRWAAGQLNIKDYTENMLYNPETNIRIGCWYLYNLTTEFSSDGGEASIVLTLAAYNGGSGNVHKWLNNKQYSYTGLTLDQIPFKETQIYVKKVLRNYKIYRWLYK